jgi:hypothetical protein
MTGAATFTKLGPDPRNDRTVAVWDAPNAETPNGRSCTQLRPAQRRAEIPRLLRRRPPGAQFLAGSQVRWGVDALGGEVSQPTWRAKPCWYLVTTEDRMIPPAAQRAMADRAGALVSEIAASHAVYVF